MTAFICTLMLLGGLMVLAGWWYPRHRATSAPRTSTHPAAVVAAALSGACVALIVTGLPAFAGITGIAAGTVPSLLHRRRQRAARWALAQAWPGVLDDVTSAVRAGLNLPEALAQAGARAPVALRDAFTAFEDTYRTSGDFTAAMETMRARVDDEVFDQLVQSLAIARTVGGHNLTDVLRSLGMFVRADLHTRGELLARQSWSVNAARMAVSAPWVVLLLLCSRPSTVAAYRTVTGVVILVAIAVTSVLAYTAMLRIARLEGMRA